MFIVVDSYSHVSIIHSAHGLSYDKPTAPSEATFSQSAI